jgi:hypothetical protein
VSWGIWVAVTDGLLVGHLVISQTSEECLILYFCEFCGFVDVDDVPLRRLGSLWFIEASKDNDRAIGKLVLLLQGVKF